MPYNFTYVMIYLKNLNKCFIFFKQGLNNTKLLLPSRKNLLLKWKVNSLAIY